MYLPSAFRDERREVAIRVIRENPLAQIITTTPELLVSAIPSTVEEVEGRLALRFHLAKHNPQCTALTEGAPCMLVFSGPSSYVSPSWYSEHPSVPTWNYISVQAKGAVETLDDASLEQLLRDLTSTHEPAVGGSWAYEEMPDDFRRELLAEICGFRVAVSYIACKAKLSQNRSLEDRERVASRLAALRNPSANAVARWMSEWTKQTS